MIYDPVDESISVSNKCQVWQGGDSRPSPWIRHWWLHSYIPSPVSCRVKIRVKMCAVSKISVFVWTQPGLRSTTNVNLYHLTKISLSLRSRRLEVVALGSSGHKKKTGAWEGDTRVSSRPPVLSFAHYFQAPATQARFHLSFQCSLHLHRNRKFYIRFIAFVRTFPNLGVTVVQSHRFSRYRGRLPISCPHWFYQGHMGRWLDSFRLEFRLRKWWTRIRNQWLTSSQ